MTSRDGFVWPESGPVEAPDWEPTYKCGHGLHGLLEGVGDSNCINWNADAKWLVVEVDESDLLYGKDELKDKCKFRRGNVVFCGDRFSATSYLSSHGCTGPIVGGTATAGGYGMAIAGDYGMATVGYRGTAAAGRNGQATAGRNGQATAGRNGQATAGDNGTATAGDNGTATAGYRGTATAGDYGTATAGYRGMATAGDNGTATAGDNGTATAGDYGTATAGDRGTATAGEGGVIVIAWYDGYRWRLAVGYVGEGIEANVAYRCDNEGNLIAASRLPDGNESSREVLGDNTGGGILGATP